MSHLIQQSWMRIVFIAMFVAMPATAMALDYGSDSLNIQVLDKGTGKAVDSAAVCLGTRANPEQFGAKRTGVDGVAAFDELLPGTLLVTVSKPGFKGGEQILGLVSKSRMFVLKISPGGGGPECNAPADELSRPESGGLAISHIGVSKADSTAEAGDLLVSVTVQGTANQIRISEHADFSGAAWQDLQSPIAYRLSDLSGAKDIFVQVRRHAQLEGANIEVISPVRRVAYRP